MSELIPISFAEIKVGMSIYVSDSNAECKVTWEGVVSRFTEFGDISIGGDGGWSMDWQEWLEDGTVQAYRVVDD